MNTAAVKCAHDEMVEISTLLPHPKNPNRHSDAQIERLGNIIEATGWRRPVRVSKLSGLVTVGHGALEAARKKGWTHVPVNRQDYVNDVEEYADMVADNAIALWSDLDINSIKLELPALSDLNFDLLGIEDFKLPALDEERTEAGSVFSRTQEQYTGSIIKQIVLFFKADTFPEVVRRANEKMEKLGLQDYSELFLRLMDEDDRNSAPTS